MYLTTKPHLQYIAHKKVAYTGTPGTTAALNGNTRVVRIIVTTAAFVTVGNNPTATTNDIYLPANMELWIAIPPGTFKVSAIQSSSGGDLHVTEFM